MHVLHIEYNIVPGKQTYYTIISVLEFSVQFMFGLCGILFLLPQSMFLFLSSRKANPYCSVWDRKVSLKLYLMTI